MKLVEIMRTNDIVVKSNQLIEAKYKLSTREQKIILYLTSQINMHDEELKMYQLSIREFCKMMGLKGSPKYQEIEKITEGLQKKLLKIKLDDKTYSVAWLSLVGYNEKQGTIDMRFDPFLKPFLIQLKKEFTKFELKNVLSLKSGSSIRLYELLKQYLVIGERKLKVDDLKELIGIGKESYPKYTDFKRKVIVVAQKEINDKTDLFFEYEEIKKGRKVDVIRFIIHSKSNVIETPKAESDSLSEALYLHLREKFKSYDYTLTKSIFKRWLGLAENIWGERKEKEIHTLTQQTFQASSIQNHLAFITYILNEKVKCVKNETSHQQVSVEKNSKRVIREEMLPSWFVDHKQKLNEEKEEKEAIQISEERKREIEEMVKNLTGS